MTPRRKRILIVAVSIAIAGTWNRDVFVSPSSKQTRPGFYSLSKGRHWGTERIFREGQASGDLTGGFGR